METNKKVLTVLSYKIIFSLLSEKIFKTEPKISSDKISEISAIENNIENCIDQVQSKTVKTSFSTGKFQAMKTQITFMSYPC